MKCPSATIAVLTAILLGCASAHGEETSATDKPDQPQTLIETPIEISAMDRAFGAFQRGMYLTAFQLALPEAEGGDAAAQTLIAELYERGLGIAQDPQAAANWYSIAAKSGNREAQFAYSVKLMEGKIIKRDIEQGLEMMKKAADAGHPTALFNYANHLVDQRPTSATYRKVLPLYEKAAEFRLADAYYALARIYEDGLANGINDPEKGRKWLEKAARSGIDTAQVELGIKLLEGEPSLEDQKQAYAWIYQAASAGNVIAQNRIAHMRFMGIGIEQSAIEGAKWYILSNRAGRKDLDLETHLQIMSDEDRQEALRRANRWPARSG